MFRSYADQQSGMLGDVYVSYCIRDRALPVVITFANGGSLVDSQNPSPPWGFEFIRKLGYNVVSFSCVKGRYNYYRCPKFFRHLGDIGSYLLAFPERLGYGASMGGFGVSAYANPLHLDRVLLVNPISTRNFSLAPWDWHAGRSRHTYSFDWSGAYNDGAALRASGYVLYDPIFDLDKKHADRYKNLIGLKTPGLGHGLPQYLRDIGILKELVVQFLEGHIDEQWFRKEIRKRRTLQRYYDWMLSSENKHLTNWRRSVIISYKKRQFANNAEVATETLLTRSDVDFLRGLALEAEEAGEFDASLRILSILRRARPNSRWVRSKIRAIRTKT